MSSSRQGPPEAAGASERLQKVLARAGVASRRRVEEMIREGRITVNGTVAELGQRVDLAIDAVKVDGRRVFEKSGERRYVLLNKPTGVLSTRRDPEGRTTVIDLLPPGLRKGMAPVGRLDYDTEGLLILTDDGEFAQRVAHPRHGCVKTYEAKVKGRPTASEIERLRAGIILSGRRATPLSVDALATQKGPRGSVSNSWWTVRLGEGRTRQIREMFFRIGHSVSRLRRVAIGPIADGHLPSGAWRELTAREVELLREHKEIAAKRPAKGRRGGGSAPKTAKPEKPRRVGNTAGNSGRKTAPKSKGVRSGRSAGASRPGAKRGARPSRGPSGRGSSGGRGPRRGGGRG